MVETPRAHRSPPPFSGGIFVDNAKTYAQQDKDWMPLVNVYRLLWFKMGVSKNGGFIMENPIKMDDN